MAFCVSSCVDGSSCNELFSERVRCVDAEIHKLLSRTTQEYEFDVNKSLMISLPNNMTYTPITKNIDNNLTEQGVSVNELNCITRLNSALQKEKVLNSSCKTNELVENNHVSDENKEQVKLAVDMTMQKAIKESVAKAIESYIDEHIDNYIQSKIEKCSEQYVSVLHSQLDELRSAQRQWVKNLTSKLDLMEQRQRHLEEVYNTDILEAKSALEVLRRDFTQQMQQHNNQVAMCNDEVKGTITECKVVLERNERQLAEQRRRHESQQHDALTSMERQVSTWISEYDKLLKQEKIAMDVHAKETMNRLDKYDDALTSVMLLCSENAQNVERVMHDALTEHSELRRCALDLNRIEMMLLSLSNDRSFTQIQHATSFLPNVVDKNMKVDNKCKMTKEFVNNRHKEALWANKDKYHAHDNVMLAQEMMRLKEDVQDMFEIVQNLERQLDDIESNKENADNGWVQNNSKHKNTALPYRLGDIKENNLNMSVNNLSNNGCNSTSANYVNEIPQKNYSNTIINNKNDHNVEKQNNRTVNLGLQRTQVGNSSLLHKTWPARYSTTYGASLRAKQSAESQQHRPSAAMPYTETENKDTHVEQTPSLLAPPPSSLTATIIQSSSETQQYVPAPTSDSESERENLQLSRLALD